MLRNQEEVLELQLETMSGFNRVIAKAIKSGLLPWLYMQMIRKNILKIIKMDFKPFFVTFLLEFALAFPLSLRWSPFFLISG